MTIYGDMEDMVNKSLLYVSGYMDLGWEPVTARLVLELSEDTKCTVVAGSHIGYYPLIVSHVNPNSQVFAFEPNPKNYERLMHNVRLNNLQNVTTETCALGDMEESRKMYFDYGQSSFLDSNRRHGGEGVVSIVRLDNYFSEKVIKPDLLILDAEGYEQNILSGAESLLSEGKPNIIFEINPKSLLAAGSSYQELCKFITSFGYTIFLIDDDYNHSLNTKKWQRIRLKKYTGNLADNVSFVNAFATIDPSRFKHYLLD